MPKDKPTILIVGGPDVDARIDLMQALNNDFELRAAGTSRGLVRHFRQAGFDYSYYPMYRGINPLQDINTMLSLWRLFRDLRPEIVHTFDTKPSAYGRLAARQAGIQNIVGTLPGAGILYTNNELITRLARFFYEPIQKVACRASNMTIFQNQDDIEEFIDRKIVTPSKAMVIAGSGICTDRFRPEAISIDQRARFRKQLGIPPDAVLITMISRLVRTKGVMEFADAAKILQQKNQNVSFLLIGPHDKRVVDQISDSELSELTQSVEWLGPRSDVPVILASSDIFAFPTYYREGVPRVLLEAGAMGLPLVTTDVPGCNDVVKDGVNGLLVPPQDATLLADAILLLIDDTETRHAFGKNAREHVVSKFDLSLVVEQTRDLYNMLMAAHNQVK